ncbi:MAG: hypothetical protein M3301_06990, partial [Chloroflexota bacterium]|nr:hypothetical protein [Chloroflexota bacterium]
ERIVAYADKRAGQRLEPMSARFAAWERRHPEYRETLQRARPLAELLEHEVCSAAGLSAQEVSRLRWVRAALAAGREPRAGQVAGPRRPQPSAL